MHPRDHERRRGDVAAHAEPVAQPLGERGLAGAELAAEHEQVARPQLPGQRPAQRRASPRRRARRRGSVSQRPPQLDVRRRRGGSRGSPAAPRSATVRGSSSRATTVRSSKPARVLDRRLDQPAGDAVALRARAATPNRRRYIVDPDRVEHQRADRLAVEAWRAARRACPAARPATRRSRSAPRPAGRAAGGPRRPAGPPRAAVAAASGPTRRTSTLTGWSTRSAAAASSWSSSALTWSCRSRITMWPAPSHSSSGEPGIRDVQLAAVADRGELVVGAADDRRSARRPQRLDGLELVEGAEAREELRDHLERRRATASRRRTRRSSAGTSSPKANWSVATVASGRLSRRTPSTARWPRARVATARRPSGAAERGRHARRDRIRCGSSPPAVVEISATPTTRSPNSSGCCSASATIAHAAHRVARPARPAPRATTSSRTCCRSRPSCSIVAWPSVDRPERPWERWS